MDRDRNKSNTNKNETCALGRCKKPDTCIHLRTLRQQQIDQTDNSAQLLYRTDNFPAQHSDKDIFYDCLSISDSDYPKEGHSCKAYASCQSNTGHKTGGSAKEPGSCHAASSGKAPGSCHAASSGKAPGSCHAPSSGKAANSCHASGSGNTPATSQASASCKTSYSCKMSASSKFDDPEAVRAALTRADKVIKMLVQNFENNERSEPCTTTMEITLRLIPDPKSSCSRQPQGRPVTMQVPLKFDPKTRELVTCSPRSMCTGCPALMYMQDERPQPQNNDDANSAKDSPCNQMNQTNKSYLNKTYNGASNSESNLSIQSSPAATPFSRNQNRKSGIDASKPSQTNTSFLYDIGTRPANFVAEQSSQTFMQQDHFSMGKIRYPTNFVSAQDNNNNQRAPDNDNNCPPRFNFDGLEAILNTKTNTQHQQTELCSQSESTVKTSASEPCICSKLVPNASKRNKPTCDADNATVYWSVRSEGDAKTAGNTISYFSAQSDPLQPVAGLTSIVQNPDNVTAYWSVKYEDEAKTAGNTISYCTAQSDPLQPVAGQPSGLTSIVQNPDNATAYWSVKYDDEAKTAGNTISYFSAQSDPLQPVAGQPSGLTSIGQNPDNATAYWSVKYDDEAKTAGNTISYFTAQSDPLQPVAGQPSGLTSIGQNPDNATAYLSLRSEGDAQTAGNTISYFTAQSDSVHPVAGQPSGLTNNGQNPENATTYHSVKSPSAGPDNCVSYHTAQSGSMQQSQNPCGLPSDQRYFALQSDGSDKEKKDDTIYRSMASDASRPNVQPNVDFHPIHSYHTAQSYTVDHSVISGNVLSAHTAQSGAPSDGTNWQSARSKCTFQSDEAKSCLDSQPTQPPCVQSCCDPGRDPQPEQTHTSSRQFCPIKDCNNLQMTGIVEKGFADAPSAATTNWQSTRSKPCASSCMKNDRSDAETQNCFYDADKSTIMTSMKSRAIEPCESEADDGEEVQPCLKLSMGYVEKTSSRSQSVMAKVTCLCSSKEKAQLGQLGRDVTAGAPFVRIAERAVEHDIAPADPLLISETSCNPSTNVVYMKQRDKFCDCYTSSETSMGRKADQGLPKEQDVEMGQASCYTDTQSTCTEPNQQNNQPQPVSYRSVRSADHCTSDKQSAMPDFKSTQSNVSKSCVTTSKYGVSMRNFNSEPESVGVVMSCANRDCLDEGAKEQEQNFYECTSDKQMSNFESCASDCGDAARIENILQTLSDTMDKSLDRTAVIRQLFRELTLMLRQEEVVEKPPPLSYEDCMEAVTAGRKPTPPAARPKTKEQKERIECLDQMEKYLEKCFPMKKSRMQPSEIVAFEFDPNFDPHRKPSETDTDSRDAASKTTDTFYDLPCTSDCHETNSKSGDSKSASDTHDSKSRSYKSPDSEAPDGKSGGSKSPRGSKSPGYASEAQGSKSISSKSTGSGSEAQGSKSISSKSPGSASEAQGSKSISSKSGGSGSEAQGSKSRESKTGSPAKGSQRQSQVSTGGSVSGSKTAPQPDESEIGKAEEEEESAAALGESTEMSAAAETLPNEESEPDDSRAIKKSGGPCYDSGDLLSPLTDRERLLCEYMMRRMCELCEEDEDLEEHTAEDEGRPSPGQPCVCCHCRALVCDNQCKTVSKTLDAIRYDPVAETKFFIDSIICDLQAMDYVMTKNKTKPNNSRPSPTLGNAPGESFPVTITDVSSLGCRALYVRWQLEDCTAIGGYEIYVDGHLTNRFFSFRHQAGVVANVDVTKPHQIVVRAQAVGQEFATDQPGCGGAMVHAHPEMLVGASRPWTPSVYLYEP